MALLVSACGGSGGSLPSQVATEFSVPNNAIADLTGAGSEIVPRSALTNAAARAGAAGTDLRFVIAGADQELLSAVAVVDAYGGTALSYKANDMDLQVASKDISAAQLDRALRVAGQETDMGSFAQAFVGVIEEEGIEKPRASFGRLLLIIVLIAAALFMIAQALAFWNARKRRLKRQREFTERKAVLRDWALQLQPQIDDLSARSGATNEAAQLTLREGREFASSIVSKIDAASTVGDLDQAEMRIGRMAIKLRDIGRALSR